MTDAPTTPEASDEPDGPCPRPHHLLLKGERCPNCNHLVIAPHDDEGDARRATDRCGLSACGHQRASHFVHSRKGDCGINSCDCMEWVEPPATSRAGEAGSTEPTWFDEQMKDPEFRRHFAIEQERMAREYATPPPSDDAIAEAFQAFMRAVVACDQTVDAKGLCACARYHREKVNAARTPNDDTRRLALADALILAIRCGACGGRGWHIVTEGDQDRKVSCEHPGETQAWYDYDAALAEEVSDE